MISSFFFYVEREIASDSNSDKNIIGVNDRLRLYFLVTLLYIDNDKKKKCVTNKLNLSKVVNIL